jgi:hypothetical protein
MRGMLCREDSNLENQREIVVKGSPVELKIRPQQVENRVGFQRDEIRGPSALTALKRGSQSSTPKELNCLGTTRNKQSVRQY